MGFIDAYKRRQLAEKGLSSGKKRRKTTTIETGLVGMMERSFGMKLVIYPIFTFVACLLVATYPGVETYLYDDPVRRSLLCVIVAVIAICFYHIRHTSKVRNGKVVLVFGGILVQVALIRMVFFFVAKNGWCDDYKLLIAPLSFVPMINSVLLGRHAGLFTALITSLLAALLVPVGEIFYFIVICLSTGAMAVALTRKMRRRSVLLRAGFYSGAVILLISIAFDKIQIYGLQTSEGMSLESMKFAAALVAGVLSGMVASGFLPILEGLFNITTTISWLEMSDLNHKLLRKLQLEAPGTYHHSMVVASLAESAAEKVGANAAMCRVCSYFHDIGKLSKPHYFIENQGEKNPHDDLTPTMSTIIIISHVKDGVDMAIKEKLNPKIIEVIREHHGTSLMRYFYAKALELRKEAEAKVEQGLENKDDIPEVDPKNFRYPGPNPSSRESGIISLADIVESASRTLKKPTPQRISKLVNELVLDRVSSGQLDNSNLTLGDIKTIRESFISTLGSMMHTRIDYPETDENKKKSKDELLIAEDQQDVSLQTVGGVNKKQENETGSKGEKNNRASWAERFSFFLVG